MTGAEDLRFSLRLARPDELGELVAIDDAATALYAEAGLHITLTATHPFVQAEAARWDRAIHQGLAHVAVDERDGPIGFMALGFVDGSPYLDQLAVRPSAMRRGVGAALLREAFAWVGDRDLWLTTYAHLPWNRPYYERYGFEVLPEHDCGPGLAAILQAQRLALPEPDQRIAMVRRGREHFEPPIAGE